MTDAVQKSIADSILPMGGGVIGGISIHANIIATTLIDGFIPTVVFAATGAIVGYILKRWLDGIYEKTNNKTI